VISMDYYYRHYAPGWVVLGLFYIICGTVQLKAVKTAVGIAMTLRTITLAEDRLVNKLYLSIALQP
jgi:hypothetical protein